MAESTVEKRAINITPYYHAVRCMFVGDSTVHEIEIVRRRWCEDGKKIVFGLDNHSAFFAAPSQWVEVVELQPKYETNEWFKAAMERDAKAMKERPWPPNQQCSGRGTARCSTEATKGSDDGHSCR